MVRSREACLVRELSYNSLYAATRMTSCTKQALGLVEWRIGSLKNTHASNCV